MLGKIEITGTIEVITGMHIGTGGDFSAIGAVDSPVVRDSRTREPIIPGSSLKGKLRSMLADSLNMGPRKDFDNDDPKIKRLFGSQNPSNTSRLIFSDMYMINKKELDALDIGATEVKYENTISRTTGVANPRQIERVIRGCCFGLDVIYTVSDEYEAEAVDDIELLIEGMELLRYDYLGGNGSRGYGKIRFRDVSAKAVFGEVSNALLEKINSKLSEFNNGQKEAG